MKLHKQFIKFNRQLTIKPNYYSIDNDIEIFYRWIECYVIAFNMDDSPCCKEIRKTLYHSINIPPNHFYLNNEIYIDLYLNEQGYLIHDIEMYKKEIRKKLKAINRIGKDKLFKYYKNNQPLYLHE